MPKTPEEILATQRHNEFCDNYLTGTSIGHCLRCDNTFVDEHPGWTCTPEVWYTRPTPAMIEKYLAQVAVQHKAGCQSLPLVRGFLFELLAAYDRINPI